MSNRSSPRGDRPNNSTFITEMSNFKRSGSLNRTGRRNFNSNSINRKKSNLPRISGSQYMFSSNFGRVGIAAEIELDQGKLDHTYELLVKEIMDLKSSIAPIRHNYLKLKDRILFQRQCTVNSNANIFLSEQLPDLANAIGEGGTFSGLIEEFQIEIDDNTNQINDLKNRFSSYWVVKLSCENDKERDELSMMKEVLSTLKSKKKKLNSNLYSLKQSANILKIDNQRKQMHKLMLDIAKAEQRNQKLQKTVQKLEKEFDLNSTLPPDQNNMPTNPTENKVTFIINDSNNNDNKNNFNFMNTPEAQAAFDEVEALEKELAEKKQLYLKKCDELIIIRNKQVKQLQELEKKQKSNQNDDDEKSTNNKEKKFHVKEPKKPPTSSGRGKKANNTPQNSKQATKAENNSNNIDDENKTNKISSEEMISQLMSYNDKIKTDGEELQEIPIEDDDDDGGIQVNDES